MFYIVYVKINILKYICGCFLKLLKNNLKIKDKEDLLVVNGFLISVVVFFSDVVIVFVDNILFFFG